MNIIDIHAHVYPHKVAVKASANIGNFYHIHMNHDGTTECLLREGVSGGVGRYVIHSVATAASQVAPINDFIASEVHAHPDRFIGFATLHPDMDDPEGELRRALNLGLKGVKLHPDFQRFRADSPEAIRLFRACAELGAPVLMHTGDVRHDFSRPWMVPPVLEACGGRLKLICAHFGGWSEWMAAVRWLKGQDIWVDTASSSYALSENQLRELIGVYGEDRVIFGSDYPMWDPGEEARQLMALGLGAEAEEKIFHRNLEKLLGLEEK